MAWVFNLGLTLAVTSKSKNNDIDHITITKFSILIGY